jgi:hypothetical protein
MTPEEELQALRDETARLRAVVVVVRGALVEAIAMADQARHKLAHEHGRAELATVGVFFRDALEASKPDDAFTRRPRA